jgi:hypothetical protein
LFYGITEAAGSRPVTFPLKNRRRHHNPAPLLLMAMTKIGAYPPMTWGQAIKNSSVLVEMVYYDACFMGALEVLGELESDGVNYSLSAGHVTTGIGGNYGYLIKLLDETDNFEIVITDYCHFLM